MRYKIVDKKHRFVSAFDTETGAYVRTGVLDDEGRDTGIDPFMASFPHLIDVGVMGHCDHGKSGLCQKAGIGCYQSGPIVDAPNMAVEDFRWIAGQCSGRTNQLALGGRGDPDCHEAFEELLRISRENGLVPNFTTSGFRFTPEKAALCGRYCGAVAVSWYRSPYTLAALRMLLDAGVKTNIHYVLGRNSIDEAVDRLARDDFPGGVNAVIFLLHKPAGLGQRDNVLDPADPRVARFFGLVDAPHPFKVGMDSCTVPGAVNWCKSVLPESLDTCEGGRFSCYIGPDLAMVPCSFDQTRRYAVQLGGEGGTTIEQAWSSAPFEAFRDKMRAACPACDKRELCMGGCPLMPEIVLCDSEERVMRPEGDRKRRSELIS